MRLDPFRPFWPWLRPYGRHVVLGLGLLLVAQAITTVMPLLLKDAIDVAQAGAAPALPIPGDARAVVAWYAGAIAVLAVVGWGVNFGMRWYFTSVSRLVERDVRRTYVRRLLHLPLRFFHEHRVGDLMARATNDVEAIQRFLNQAFRMTLTGVLTFWLSLAMMCLIDWQLALLSLAPMPVMVLATNVVSGRVRDGFRRVQEQFAAISARIQENLSGMRVVKACAIEPREVDAFARLNEDYVERNRELVRVRSLFFPFTGLLNGVSMVVVFWLGGLRVIDGALSLGSFVAINAYLLRMGRPMMMLGRMVDEYQRAVASLARLRTVIDHPPEDRGAGLARPLRGEVELRDVTFTYPGAARPVLDGISLRLEAGKSLAIVGRVGSGKSTLARLLPRLLEPTSGEVLVDGVPLRQWPLAALRAAIGYVPQDAFLFSESIADNLLVGLDGGPDAPRADAPRADDPQHRDGPPSANGDPDPRLEWAAGISQLAGDLAVFPAGYQTVVGERGVTLSGGQKQRTALARAIIRQPRILILDDALASVDTDTEERILAGLRDIMRTRTTIVIAHRLSTVRDADHIVVLDGGRIAEQGTHAQLVERDGIYADMHRRQTLAHEITRL